MRAPYHKIAQAIVALAMMLFCASGIAQTITIHMLNGKSGKPMRDRSIRVQFQGSSEKPDVAIDKHGDAYLNIPPGATSLSLIAATRGKGSTQPAYIVCGPFGQFIPIKDILEHGYVPQDACSATLQLTARPGELFYLIEPLPWYTPALQ